MKEKRRKLKKKKKKKNLIDGDHVRNSEKRSVYNRQDTSKNFIALEYAPNFSRHRVNVSK